MHGPPPLLVFAEDWGRHASGCQHLVRHLLPTRQVIWVNTIGTRRPKLNWATARRGMEKFRHWRRPGPTAAPAVPNLTVVNPVMWPSFASTPSRGLNRRLLMRQLAPVVRALPTPPVAVTKTAIVADLIGRLPVRRWVYYCVDDFSKWPGLDQATLRRMEADLAPRVDVAVAVSETLREHLRTLGAPPAHLLTHGIDPGHWTAGGPLPVTMAGLTPPLVVFWGLIDRRLDVAWLAQLGQDLTEGTIVLVGPESAPDPALSRVPRLVRRPAAGYDQLPAVAAAAVVLIMPYADLPVTRAMQPLKLKEYLATGKPVVAADLPATRAWTDCLDMVGTADEFSQAVRRRIAEGTSEGQTAARRRLTGEEWSQKAVQLANWIDDPGTAAEADLALEASGKK
jgi:glycosyltransferase involved in cell wall biosynthesis